MFFSKGRLALMSFAVLLGATLQTTPARAEQSCLSHIEKAERYYDMPRGLLLAIALTESQYNNRPHPWTLNIGGKPVYKDTKEDISKTLMAEIRKSGTRSNIAVGCMQIYLKYHSFRNPLEILEPRANVWYAARFLYTQYRRLNSWTHAVGYYHAGNNLEARNPYICRVWKTLRDMGGGAKPGGARYCS